MKTNMYTVYDSKAKSYSLPFHAVTDDVAVRMFKAAVNDPSTTLNKHAEDFVLYRIGAFDDEDAVIITTNQTAITTAIALKEQDKTNDEN